MIRNLSAGRRAFTLVELLVVIAVIALLIGVLLPALGQARGAAQKAQGASLQRQLLLGLATYAAENREAIPGVNTTGRRLEQWTSGAEARRLDRSSNIPVQNYDWFSPALNGENMSTSRAQRFVEIMTNFSDPTQSEQIGSGQLANASPELIDALDVQGTMPAPSFFMPTSWQFSGVEVPGSTAPGSLNPNTFGQIPELSNVVELPTSWNNRISSLGSTSEKVAIADGFVDLSNAAYTVDAAIWVAPGAQQYGAFLAEPPVKEGSINYADFESQGGLSNNLAFRHSGSLNAGFWDGHVASLTRDEVQNPSLWFPTGSTFRGSGATQDARQFYDDGDRIN